MTHGLDTEMWIGGTYNSNDNTFTPVQGKGPRTAGHIQSFLFKKQGCNQ